LRPDGPRLALIGAESALRDQAHEVLSQVWTGQIRAVDTVHADAVVVVLVTQNVDDGLRLAARLDGPLVARIPVLLVTLDGARRLRTIALPAPVAWVLNGNELDPRMVGLAIRYALEVGTRWRLGDQVQALKPLADVGTITTVTSHEISNALTSLLLDLEFAQALVERGNASEQLPAVLGDAYEAARHLGRVAADLARVSRPVGRLTTVEAVDLAESARRLCSDVLRGVSTRVVVARPVRVRADERRATQVLVNLIRNAGQAMAGRDGATLELTIARECSAYTPWVPATYSASGASRRASASDIPERTPRARTSYEHDVTTPRQPVPPTTTSRPTRLGSSRRSTDTKNVSRSRQAIRAGWGTTEQVYTPGGAPSQLACFRINRTRSRPQASPAASNAAWISFLRISSTFPMLSRVSRTCEIVLAPSTPVPHDRLEEYTRSPSSR
jgi:hypothetical protein